MKNDLAGIPKVSFPFVDVRDVALAHVIAIEKEDLTDGKRYVLSENTYWFEDVINILRDEFGKYGYKMPSFNVGSCIFSIVSIFDK